MATCACMVIALQARSQEPRGVANYTRVLSLSVGAQRCTTTSPLAHDLYALQQLHEMSVQAVVRPIRIQMLPCQLDASPGHNISLLVHQSVYCCLACIVARV